MNSFVIKPRAEDYVKGVNSPIVFKAVNPNGWTSRLEFFENQRINGETEGCELFTAQESMDAQMDFIIASGAIPQSIVSQLTTLGYFDMGRDGLPHFHSSPRFLQIQTGNGYNGNSAQDPWDAARKYGIVPWKDLPYDETTPMADYLTGVTPEMLAKGQQFLTIMGGKNAISYHWIQNGFPMHNQAMIDGLPQAPLCAGIAVLIPGWNQVNPTDPPMTQPVQHAVMIYNIVNNSKNILDHYLPYEKVLDPTYPIPYVMQGIIQCLVAEEQQIVSTIQNIVTQTAQTPASPQSKNAILNLIKVVIQAFQNLFNE